MTLFSSEIAQSGKEPPAACQSHLLPSLTTKAAQTDLQAITESGIFEGYACLFGIEDLGHDVIAKGAFAKSLSRRGVNGVKLLSQHDPAQPIGRWLDIREDAKGLYVKGQLLPQIDKAKEILAMMKNGILDGLSIGFRTIKSRKSPIGSVHAGCRHLLEVDLWEISVVTFPMQPEARVNCLKNEDLSKRELERKLMQDAGLSRSQARALLARGYHGLIDKQDAVEQVQAMTHMLRKATHTMINLTR